ncbi:hypothetical protein ABW20_dc0103794 [Dactylellina cionopaga]|nr:hypothetical protein ABW20_dc0103794 [Dactylellina cionopaga]
MLIHEWPNVSVPSQDSLINARWPTAMESQIETLCRLILQNQLMKRNNFSSPIITETDSPKLQSPEEERLANLERIIPDTDFMDLICIVGSYNQRQGILCHRIVVCKLSPHLDRIVAKRGVQVPYELNLDPEITAESFFKVLDWCYKAIRPTVQLTFQELAELYVTTQILEMHTLKEITISALQNKDIRFAVLEASEPILDSEGRIKKEFVDYGKCLSNIFGETSLADADKYEFPKIATKSLCAMGTQAFKILACECDFGSMLA